MPDEIAIQVRFTVDTERGPYSDALYFTEAEWAKRDDKAVEAAKQARADNWIAMLAVPPREETKESKQNRHDAIGQQIAAMTLEKDALAAELAKAE